MSTPFNDRLGQKGYTMVARAPDSGVPRLADGAWYVMGGSIPSDPDRMHEIDRELIPFILSKGGDVVLYRLPPDGIGDPVPVLTRGGMSGRPPHLNHVRPYDAGIVEDLTVLRDASLVRLTPPPAAPKRTDYRAAACVAATLALLLAGGVWWGQSPTQVPDRGAKSWIPDPNDPREVAQSKGATVMVMPNAKDPDMMEMYRIYPNKDGTQARDHVASFQRRDLERHQGPLPDSHVDWRRQ